MDCPNCEAMDWPSLPDGSYTCSACRQTYYLRTSGARTAPPQITHHCPNCEAAAREIADLHALCERQANILSRVAVVLRGPEPPQTRWSHHDLPERTREVQVRAYAQLADLRARLAAECESLDTTLMELYAIGEVLAVNEVQPHLNRLRDLLRKEAK